MKTPSSLAPALIFLAHRKATLSYLLKVSSACSIQPNFNTVQRSGRTFESAEAKFLKAPRCASTNPNSAEDSSDHPWLYEPIKAFKLALNSSGQDADGRAKIPALHL